MPRREHQIVYTAPWCEFLKELSSEPVQPLWLGECMFKTPPSFRRIECLSRVSGLAGRAWTGSQLSLSLDLVTLHSEQSVQPSTVALRTWGLYDINAMSVILIVDQTDVQFCTQEFFYFNHTGSVSTSLTPWNPLLCPLPKLPTHCVRYIDGSSGNQPLRASPVRRQTGAMR